MTDLDAGPHPRSTAYPRTIDATPARGDSPDESAADGYDRSFLEAAGYLSDPETVRTTYVAGSTVEYLASTDGPVRLAYFEFPAASAPPTTPTRIAAAIGRRTRLEYCWFVDPETGRITVFRTSQRAAPFRYDPDRQCDAAARRRRDRLERARTDVDALFDRRDLRDRFADEFRSHRLALARALTTDDGRPLSDRAALFAAERLLHRLCCWYFLVDRGLIGLVDESDAIVPADPGRLFARLVRDADEFASLLRTIGDALESSQRDELVVTDAVRLSVPTLPTGLFEPVSLEPSAETCSTNAPALEDDPDPVFEADLAVEGFDWSAVVDDFGAYEWRLETAGGGSVGSPIATNDTVAGESAGTITPTLLSEALETVAGDDPVTDGDSCADHGEVGAYYTDDAITDFVVRRALWEALREKLEAGIESGEVPRPFESAALYRPAREKRPAVERAQRDGFDVLFEAYADDREVLASVDAKIRELTVCDPAVGTGAFALTAAETLFEWRAMCRPDRDPFALRRDVVTRNVFGVDLLDRSTAVCELRLWLWLVGGPSLESATDGRTADSSADGPTAPRPPTAERTALGRSIRSGNSLVGFADPDELPRSALDEIPRSPLDDVSGGEHEGLERWQLAARYGSVRTELDDRYAGLQRDPSTDAPLRISDPVSTPADAARSLAAAPADETAVRVALPDGIPDAVDASLEALGVTTYTYTARLESPSLEDDRDRQRLNELFDRLEGHVDDGHLDDGDWSVTVERPYVGRDFRASALDACHWPLEFPRVFLEDGGFDVVVSNPPYGATVSPVAEPLLRSTANYECQGAGDTCEWFYERALELATDTGVVGCLVPKAVAFYRSWADIRERLLAETAFSHVFDVGHGFEGVTLETIAVVQTLTGGASGPDTDGDPERGPGTGDGTGSTPAIHRSRDLRNPSANRPVHLGWADQRFMRDGGTIVFRPITDDEAGALQRILATDRRLEDVASGTATRQLYVPDREKARLGSGSDPYIDAVPWVRPYHLTDVRHVDLEAYRDAVETYAVPRVMLKVLRGSRLRAWLDPRGELVGTEKLVSVPLEDHNGVEIAFVYAVLNHPFTSYYLQKAIFSETTETARVMDGHYSHSIPVPDPGPALESAVARLAWTLTLARQSASDADRDPSSDIDVLQDALEALVACCYLDREAVCRPWIRDLDRDGPSEPAVRDLFEAFYTDRFATRGDVPASRRDEIRDLLAETADVVSRWDTERVLESQAMTVVRDVLE